jgi:hypothetical protein
VASDSGVLSQPSWPQRVVVRSQCFQGCWSCTLAYGCGDVAGKGGSRDADVGSDLCMSQINASLLVIPVSSSSIPTLSIRRSVIAYRSSLLDSG